MIINQRTIKGMEEHATRILQTRSEKEARIVQQEQEIERLKSNVTNKERRVDELEKQHQADRARFV